MVFLKTDEEVALMRESALLVSSTLAEVARHISIGITPLELDIIAEKFIVKNNAVPGFKGYRGFPNTLCMSVNDAVVHGICSGEPLKGGDIVSIDCGVLKNGFYGDSAFTFALGDLSNQAIHLLKITRASLELGLSQAVVGNRTGDIGFAIQQYCEKENLSVVRELVGHGIGRSLHEEPEVPNFGKRGRGVKLKENTVIAIEPMINVGGKRIITDNDEWTIRTRDGSLSAHFEHTVVVKKGQPDILTDFKCVDEQIKNNKYLLEIQ